MDYNYVRMRNALKNGDFAEAEEYKLLYETGKVKRKAFSALDYVVAILVAVSVLLGAYILHCEIKSAENTVITEVAK